MPRGDSKSRMVASAVTLLREGGAAAVTIDAVLAHSGAPRGSVYHHFPGGRDQLLLTAGHSAATYITNLITEAAASNDPIALIDRFVDFWKRALISSEYSAGCPVVSLAVNARDDLPEAAELVHDTFAAWQQHLTAVLAHVGRPHDDAAALATLMICAIEGAILLCRAQRSLEPLNQVAVRLRSAVSAPS
jgi:AcrR family transcriptional regulator